MSGCLYVCVCVCVCQELTISFPQQPKNVLKDEKRGPKVHYLSICLTRSYLMTSYMFSNMSQGLTGTHLGSKGLRRSQNGSKWLKMAHWVSKGLTCVQKKIELYPPRDLVISFFQMLGGCTH